MGDRHAAKLGIAHLTALELEPQRLVRIAAQTGFQYVGLRFWPAFAGSISYFTRACSSEMRELKKILRDEGVHVHDVEVVTLDQAFDLDPLKHLLESAADVGATRLNVCGDDPDRARLVANLSSLCEEALQYRIGIDLEFMRWRSVGCLADANSVLDASRASNAALLIDSLHLSRSGSTPDDLKGIPPVRLQSAQLSDAPAAVPTRLNDIVAEARKNRLAPGTGELPLVDLVRALPNHVVYSVEVPSLSTLPPDIRLREVLETATRVLAAR
jgi:sugar phosphate isomerase/epimerase